MTYKEYGSGVDVVIFLSASRRIEFQRISFQKSNVQTNLPIANYID